MTLRTRTATAIIALVVGGSALAGCGGDPEEPETAPAVDRTAAASTPPPPKRGACYRLTVADAMRATNGAAPVPCTGRHNAVTVSVGRLRPVLDGHLLAVDSSRVQRQVATRCRALVDRHVGGSTETQRLSRVQAVWFSPTLAQSDAGALWFRCDLVIVSGTRSLASLPRTTAGLLDRPGILSRYGTCGTAAPSAKTFARVLCAAKHTWRARATIALPRSTPYLAKAAGTKADRQCRDVAARRTGGAGKFRWSFEWPTKAQWAAGQRYGLCWTPT